MMTMGEAKLNREETIQELRELIHEYPIPIPSDARRGLKDALAILDPDPRVLSLEELQQLPAQTIVWTEYWNGEDGKASDELLAAMKCYDGTFVDEDASVYSDFDKDMTPDRFDGSYWRFWSAKPTDEQRRKVAWK